MRITSSGAALALVLGSCVATPGCVGPTETTRLATVSVVQTGSLAVALTGARTVAIHPRGRMIRTKDDRGAREVMAEIERSISYWFENRGYVMVPADDADALVAYAIGVTGELEDEELERIYGITAGMRLGGDTDRGGIVLSVIRRNARHATWRASASGDGSPDREPGATREGEIRAAVSRLLAGVPQQSRKR